MSEILQNQHVPEEVQQTQESSRIQALLHVGQYALHNAGVWINERRLERAGSVLEKMDHKDALFTNMGDKYMSGSVSQMGDRGTTETTHIDEWDFPHGTDYPEIATPAGTHPRTVFDRVALTRMEKKRENLKRQRGKRKYYESAFHIYETQNPAFYDRDSDVMRVTPSHPVDVSGRKARFLSKARQAGIGVGYLTGRGIETPEDARRAMNLAKVHRPAQETRLQRKYRKREARDIRHLRSTATQPLRSKSRDFRRERAIGKIQASHRSAERHRTKNVQVRQLQRNREETKARP